MSLLLLIGSNRIPSLLILCFLNINPSSGLQKGEENVCSKLRSVKVLDVYPSNWTEDWDCQSYFPEISCDRIRSGEVDIESVYFVLEEFTCCPGWTMPDDGKHCNKSCESGFYGEKCQFPCRCFNSPDRTTCKATDGSCDCSPGWTGRECDQRCNPGTFGAGCSERSLFTCQNGGSNDPVTGACLCLSRYIGPACEFDTNDVNPIECERCPQTCDKVADNCRCNDGYRGRYCSDMCEVGTRGLFCGEKCCSGNGHCLGEAESCLCQDGYTGEQCQSQCENGNYDRNCQKECLCESCNHITGVCSTCPSGFKGDTCTMICSSSEWGESCNNTCQCANNQPCDVFSGKCPQSGFAVALVSIIAVIFIAGLLILLCVTLRCILKRRNMKVQNENNQTDVENDVDFTLGARSESSQVAGLTLPQLGRTSADLTDDGAYAIPRTQHSQNGDRDEPYEYSDIYLTPRLDRLSSVLTENDTCAPIESIIVNNLETNKENRHQLYSYDAEYYLQPWNEKKKEGPT
ncbi:uncharacterized protein [Apostichopus japonicus]|uniref:uncharacterized protein n=1 Tax=Stichopus japonicus TaxID=307972 RepID=UPI003AB5B8D8